MFFLVSTACPLNEMVFSSVLVCLKHLFDFTLPPALFVLPPSALFASAFKPLPPSALFASALKPLPPSALFASALKPLPPHASCLIRVSLQPSAFRVYCHHRRNNNSNKRSLSRSPPGSALRPADGRWP
jgi:hypothetical protein